MIPSSVSAFFRPAPWLLLIATASCAPRPSTTPSSEPMIAPRAESAPHALPPAPPATLPMDQASVAAREFQAEAAPMLRAANYLGIVELLEKKQQAPGLDSSTKTLLRQLAGTYAPFVGQYQEALEDFAPRPSPRAPIDTASLARMRDEDAVDAVARLAANRQAVFVDEAHQMARHRAFTANLLPRLRAAGFSYLVVESVSASDTGLTARGYPVHETGFYANEPVFGEMLRIALGLGFTIVPYDSSTTGDEQAGARGIADRILRTDPKAKIVVHAGAEHIDESGTLAGAKSMAMWFREITGIDPLTVDQTAMTEQADTTYEDSRYLFLMKHVRSRMPFVLEAGDSVWSAHPGSHDVTVISPRAVHRAGRPSWLWTMGGAVRRAYIASDEACPGSLDCLMAARRVGERDDAVPVDVLRVQFSAPGSKTFALPPGQYVIEAKDANGAALSRQTISVPAGR